MRNYFKLLQIQFRLYRKSIKHTLYFDSSYFCSSHTDRSEFYPLFYSTKETPNPNVSRGWLWLKAESTLDGGVIRYECGKVKNLPGDVLNSLVYA